MHSSAALWVTGVRSSVYLSCSSYACRLGANVSIAKLCMPASGSHLLLPAAALPLSSRAPLWQGASQPGGVSFSSRISPSKSDRGGCSVTCSSSGGNSVLRTAGEPSSGMKPSCASSCREEALGGG